MDINRFGKGRMIRDGVAQEIAIWLDALVNRVEKVEDELSNQQSDVNHHMTLFQERKRELEAVEGTIDIMLRRHGRADMDMLVHFASELRSELMALTRDLEKLLSASEEEEG